MSSINWNTFQAKFGENCHVKFENLARMIFKIKELNDPYINLVQLPNQAGIEVEPVSNGKEKISFQAKFFTLNVDYNNIKESADEIKEHYKDKVDRVILYCNKKLNYYASKTYANTIQSLKDVGIVLEQFCDENILDLLKTNDKYSFLKEFYFGEKDYSNLIKARCNHFCNSIKRNLINNKFIDREEKKELIKNLDKKYIILHGDANTGKSAIIGSLCEYFESQNMDYLPISLDINYPEKNLLQFSQTLGFSTPLKSLMYIKNQESKQNNFYLILDQFDAIRWNSFHSVDSLIVCEELIESISKNKNVSVIITTRTVDLGEVRSIINKYNNDFGVKEIKVSPINEQELKSLVPNNFFEKMNDDTKNLLRTIGNLKIYQEIADDSNNFVSQVDLLTKFFEKKYETLKQIGCDEEARHIEEFIVSKQRERNVLYVTEQEIELNNFRKSTLDKMIEIGILEKTKDKLIKYTHQCLYDFNLAKNLYLEYKDKVPVKSLIKRYNKNALQYLDLIKQFLEILKSENIDYYKVIEEIIFDNKIRYLFKKIALDEFASYGNNSQQEVELFIKIIKSPNYGKKYIYQLAINKPLIVKYLINEKFYQGELLDFDFNQYLSILKSVIENDEIFVKEYLRLIDENSENKERLNRLILEIDDDCSSDILFNKKIEIIRNNHNLVDYPSVEKLDSKYQNRIFEYIKLIIDIDNPRGILEFIQPNKILKTLETYSYDVSSKIYEYFLSSNKTYGLNYSYNVNMFHSYEKLDWLKECFSNTLKYLDKKTLIKYLDCDIGFVVDSVLSIIPEIDNGGELLNYMIESKFITKQNFHYFRNRIHLISKCILCYNSNISTIMHRKLEQEILNYRIPNIIEFAKECLKIRHQGIYKAFFGEEQKILLSSLNQKKLSNNSKEFLRTLNRRFTKLEEYSEDFKEGVTEVHTVVSCIDNKNLSKNQWIRLLTNNKTGRKKVFDTKVDKKGNYVSSDFQAIRQSVFLYANKNKGLFIDILHNNNIREDFIPTILEALATEQQDSKDDSQYNESILKLFEKYFNTNGTHDEYVISSFLRFIKSTNLSNEWIINKLIEISKLKLSNTMQYVGEEDEYMNIWQEHFSNNQTIAINLLVNIMYNLNEKPVWLEEILDICRKNEHLILKLSELEILCACINFNKDFAFFNSIKIIENYPLFVQNGYFINLLNNCIKEKNYRKIFNKWIKNNFKNSSLKIKGVIIGRLINYYVHYGFYKTILNKIIKSKEFKTINITPEIFNLLNTFASSKKSNTLTFYKINRLTKLLNKLIKYNGPISKDILLKIKDNVNFYEEYGILDKILLNKNIHNTSTRNLLNIFKELSPITKYDEIIYKASLNQIKNNAMGFYHINDIISCFYKIYGEYDKNDVKKKEKCIRNIEEIYKILYNIPLTNL